MNNEARILHATNLSLLVFIIFGFVGLAVCSGFMPPPPQYLSATEVAHYFRENEVGVKVGMLMVLCSAPFYLVWTVVLGHVLEKIVGASHVLTKIQMFSGSVASLTLALAAVIWQLMVFRLGHRSNEEIQLLYDFGWLMLDLPFMFFVVQYAAIGLLVLNDKSSTPALPRWIAWFGFYVSVIFITAAIVPFVESGPFAWHGLITFWVVFSVFFIYIISFMVLLSKAIKQLYS